MSAETTLLVKHEVHVFKIPPRTSAKGYRAADWDLSTPLWSGRLRIMAQDRQCSVRLEDKSTLQLFANCPIDQYPGVAVEPVADSSRYFVLRVVSDDDRTAFLGIGFPDRSDSFDFNVALQDHFSWLQRETDLVEQEKNRPVLDLGFKQGQTIKIDMKITKKKQQEQEDGDEEAASSSAAQLPKPASANTPLSPGSLLPPPPSVAASNRVAASHVTTAAAGDGGEAASPAASASKPGWVQF